MKIFQSLVVCSGIFFLLIGMLFLFGFPRMSVVWLNLYLIGSTLVAYAIPTMWIGVTKTYRALVGGGLSTMIAFGGSGLFLLHLSKSIPAYHQVGDFCLYIAILAIWFVLIGVKSPRVKSRRLPRTTQWLMAFAFTVALLQGLYLIVPLPGRFPWILTPELSVIYGWSLIGAALFFGWGLIQPIWENGYPILYALLTFDVLLIGPLLSLFKESSVPVVPIYVWFAVLVVGISGVWAFLELIAHLRMLTNPRNTL